MQKEAIYIATIATLAIHIAVFGILYYTNPLNNQSESLFAKTVYDELEISMDNIEIEDEKLSQEDNQKLPDHLEEKIRNYIENQNAEQASEYSSYSQAANDRLEQEIQDELKGLENDVINELHKDDVISDPHSQDANTSEDYQKSDKLWSAKDKSYNGRVSVSYKIIDGDRERRYLPTPGYKCLINGTVTIDISVAKSGEITECSLNNLLTNTSNECLIKEALAYAKKSSFVSSIHVPRKQSGTITYIFSAQ